MLSGLGVDVGENDSVGGGLISSLRTVETIVGRGVAIVTIKVGVVVESGIRSKESEANNRISVNTTPEDGWMSGGASEATLVGVV